jgi:hypothetical protein
MEQTCIQKVQEVLRSSDKLAASCDSAPLFRATVWLVHDSFFTHLPVHSTITPSFDAKQLLHLTN